METVHLGLCIPFSLCIMSGVGLYLFPSASGGSFPDDGSVRYKSEFSRILFSCYFVTFRTVVFDFILGLRTV